MFGGNESMKKIEKTVTFPLKNMKLADVAGCEGHIGIEPTFELIGVSHHSGTLSSGKFCSFFFTFLCFVFDIVKSFVH